MDHCTETKKRSGQTGDWGKKDIYWDGRIRISTGIAPTLKCTPSRILLTSSMTTHSILPCTKPGNKIPYPPTDVTTTRNTRNPDHYWRWQWRIRWTKWQLLHCGINLFHASLLPPTLSKMQQSRTSILWMSTIHISSLLSTSSRTPSFWLLKTLKPVTSTIVGDIVMNSFLCTMCRTCFHWLFFIYDRTCIHLKANMPFTYVYHIFTLCFTCVGLEVNTPSYLFKPVVRQLYSLAFHWEFYHSYSEPLDPRQYLAIGTLRVTESEHWLELDTRLLDCQTIID